MNRKLLGSQILFSESVFREIEYLITPYQKNPSFRAESTNIFTVIHERNNPLLHIHLDASKDGEWGSWMDMSALKASRLDFPLRS